MKTPILLPTVSKIWLLNKLPNNLLLKEKTLNKTSIGRLRLIGISEGISFLVLLGIAMPLKYMFGIPLAVKIVGWLHGALFILYVGAVIQVKIEKDWPTSRAIIAFIAALLPLGTFVFDKSLRKEEEITISD